MRARKPLWTLFREVVGLADAPPWAAPAIVVLSLAGAAMEGAGLYLFIPLVQSLGGANGAGGWLARLFDRLLSPIATAERTPLLVCLLVLSIVAKNLISFAAGYISRYVEGVVAHRLRARVFEQTIASCIDYRVKNRLSDIVNTMATNTWKVSSGLSLCYRLIVCGGAFAVFLVLLLLISAPLTGFALAMLGLSWTLAHMATRRAEATGRAVVEENRQFGLRMWEGVTSLKLIRSFAREGYEIDRFRAVSERIRRRILHLDLLWAAPAPMSEVLGAMLMGALILAGVAVGLGVAPLVAFLAVLYRSLGPTREFLQDKVALEGMVGAIEDVSDYLAATREPYLLSGPRPAPDFAGEVEFRAVSFRYAPTEPLALDRVSFSVRKGQTTAIVGRSGAGKTTLMELFFRFRDPTSGEILADGERLTDLDLAGWRSRLSLMSQDAQLFNETVAANIGYGDLAADDRAIRRAAEVAGAAEFIEALPDGYQTHLGDRGMRLSGGQRQRIALARTILKNPQILLLDEPTNALDGESERRFQTALEAYARGRTVVVIAHRLSTVRGAHQVIVLEAGRVVERGRPEELLSRPGHFARLYGLQADPRREAV